MESGKMVIDTSIFIEHLRAINKATTTLSTLPDNIEIFISSVTVDGCYERGEKGGHQIVNRGFNCFAIHRRGSSKVRRTIPST